MFGIPARRSGRGGNEASPRLIHLVLVAAGLLAVTTAVLPADPEGEKAASPAPAAARAAEPSPGATPAPARPAEASSGAPPSAAGSSGDSGLEARLEQIEATLEAERTRLHIPGMAIAVVKDDRILLLEGLGVRELEHERPVTPDTLFPIGSCTKAFTALAVVVAQERGKLTLDDRPHTYLPDFHMADPEADRLVTLRDMLSHRTGLRGYADLAAEPGVLTRDEYVRAATGAKPTAKLREKFQYSNAMYVAAGQIAAGVYGWTWEQMVIRTLFAPTGMRSSYGSAARAMRARNHATGYVWNDEAKSWHAEAPPASLKALAPAGAIASTARDMSRWLRMLIAGGTIDGKRVVSEAGLLEATTPHTRINASWSYGLGWALYDWNGHKVVEHNGGSTGLSALMSFMPEQRAGFVILANVSPTSLTAIGNAGKMLWPLITGESEVSAPGPGPREEAAAAAAASASTTAASASTTAAGTSSTATAPDAGADKKVEGLPTVSELLPKMIAAAGGERNLRRHTTLEARYRKRYQNHGVNVSLRVRARAPDHREEIERWRAAGRPIGTLRTWYNGKRGAQETTFGQDEVYSGEQLEEARRAAVFQPLLELKRLYPDLAVTGRTVVGDQEAWLLESGFGAGRVTLAVSTRTWLVLRREKGRETTTWSDMRMVDGEVVPFRAVINDPLGETTLRLKSIRFNVPVPSSAFRPAGKGGGDRGK